MTQVDGQVVALLVQNLERLDEGVKEEADGVHNTLGKGLFQPTISSHFFYDGPQKSEQVFLYFCVQPPPQMERAL